MQTAFINWLVPFLCAGAITIITTSIIFFKAFRNGLQCLLRAEIIRSHEKYVELKGYCPIYAKEALTRAYKAYHTLKGNDVATALYEEIMALPETPPHNSEK